MIKCIIICATVVFCIIYILHWLKSMTVSGYPHITVGHLTPASEEPAADVPAAIGYVLPSDDGEPKESDVEQRNKLLRDMASTYTAIMRGEFDLDEFGR